ncbi:MAG: AMP-binding protein, partial [Lachnospiraceae bacterium]|nr:AMP-binding protein [Lachnospiraceae bacterium]
MDKQVIRPEIIHSDYIAMKDDKGNCLTYEELYQRAQLLKDTLEERSLSFILCDFAMETAELIYEVLSSNRVPLLLSADINPVFLDKLADKYMPQYIWCKKEHPYTKKEYIVVKERESHVILKMTDKRIKIHPDVALLLSTSGSTGSAKLVKLSYENLYNNAEYACKHCEINATRKAITNLPLNYTFGLCFCLWHWNCGAAVLFSQHSILSKQYSVFFEQEKVTDFAAVPYTYQMLDKINFWNDSKKKYLNMVMVGGAKITNELLEKMVSKLGDKFWIGYGQTECTCIVSGTNFINKHIKYGTIGKAFENMHISLDQETNELIIKSKSVCMGYAYEGKQLADGNVNGFVLQTGDVAEIDEEGYIYLK